MPNKKRTAAKIRVLVIERVNGFCEYCCSNSKFGDSPFDVEHIMPESKGGKMESANLAFACHGCNLFKSNKTEYFDGVTDKTVKLFNPRIDIFGANILFGRVITL